jgi:hypothetical protein
VTVAVMVAMLKTVAHTFECQAFNDRGEEVKGE